MSFFEFGANLFLLFLSPIVGLLINYIFNQKIQYWLLWIMSILILPILTPYDYVIPYMYEIIGVILCGLIYARVTKNFETTFSKIMTAVVTSVLLFIVLGFCLFFDSFGGYTDINQTWSNKEYRVEKRTSYAFSGRPGTWFHLEKYSWIPLFKREIGVLTLEDSTDMCLFHMKEPNVTFNSCTGNIRAGNN